MRVLHTSDWHFGRSIHGADLTPAFEMWAHYVVNLVREKKIDLLLISGDIFDRPHPSAIMTNLLDETLTDLAQLCEVVIISGNHDSASKLNFCSRLMHGVHIRTNPCEAGDPICITAPTGELQALIYPIPYIFPETMHLALAQKLSELPECSSVELEGEINVPITHEGVLRAALELVRNDLNSRTDIDGIPRILMAHTFVSGAQPSDSENHRTYGGIDSVPSHLFAFTREDEACPALDYVALGHLHSPQHLRSVTQPIIRYSGSPIAFSFSETRAKSSVLLEFSGRTITSLELLPAPIWRPIKRLEGKLEELLGYAATESQSFVELTVTNNDKPLHMRSQLARAYEHPLVIQHKPEAGIPRLSQALPVSRTSLSGVELIEKFMSIAGGKELTSSEKKILEEVWNSCLKTGGEA